MQYLEFLSRTTNSSVFYQSALRSIKSPVSKDIPWIYYYYLADLPLNENQPCTLYHAILKEMQKSRIIQTLKTKPGSSFFDAKLL